MASGPQQGQKSTDEQKKPEERKRVVDVDDTDVPPDLAAEGNQAPPTRESMMEKSDLAEPGEPEEA